MVFKKFAVLLLFLTFLASFIKKSESAFTPYLVTPLTTHSLAVTQQQDNIAGMITPGYLTLKMVDMASNLVTDIAYNLSRVLLL